MSRQAMKPGYESQNILASALRCDSIPHSCINVEILIFRESPLFCFTLHYLWGWISRGLSVSWSTDEISGSCWWGRKAHSRHWSHLRAYLRRAWAVRLFWMGLTCQLVCVYQQHISGGEFLLFLTLILPSAQITSLLYWIPYWLH